MSKHNLLTSGAVLLGAMTPIERQQGRYMRAPDGHDGGATPAAAPADASTAAQGDGGAAAEPTGNEMPAIEAPATEGPKETTAEDLEREFRDPTAPAAEPAKDDAEARPAEDKPAEEAAKTEEKPDNIKLAEERARFAQEQADFWRKQAEQAKPAEEAKPGEKDPNAEPKAEDYEFGEADVGFIRDTARFHARQEFQQQQDQASTNAEISRLEANYQGNVAKAAERYPDFDEKVTQSAAAGKWPCPPLIALGIRDSDVGPDIAYHLATNVSEAKRIADLSPILQARELGRLEARFQSANTKPTEQKPTTKVTQAPEPPASMSRGAGGRFTVSADTEDFSQFEKSADAILAK